MQILESGSDDEVSDLIDWVLERAGPGQWRDELDQVLNIRARYPGGIWHWTAVVISEQLLWALPRSGNFADRDLPAVLTAICEFLTTVDKHPRANFSESGILLAEHAQTLEAQFIEAMGTKGRWGPNRRMMSAMGVDLADVIDMSAAQARLNRATREYNQLSSVERARIGGPTIRPGTTIVGHDYLPLTAALTEDNERSARQSRLWNQISQLVEYTAGGITLTANGNIPLAAGQELVQLLETGDEFDPVFGDRTFKTQSTQELRGLMELVDLATASGFVTKRKTTLRTSGKARTLVSDPVATVSALLKAGVDRGWQRSPHPDFVKFGAYCTKATLLDIYEVREPVTLADVIGVTGQRLRATFDLYHDTPTEYTYLNSVCETGILNNLDLLADLNILTINPPDSLARRRNELLNARLRQLPDGELLGEHPSAASIVAEINLTALGLELVQPWAAEHGNAQLIEAVAGDDPIKVLAIAAARTGENAAFELAEWMRSANAFQRATLTSHALRSESEVTRSVALRALIGCGEPTTSSTLAAAANTGGEDQQACDRLWAWTLIADAEHHNDIAREPLDDDRWIALIGETLVTLGPASLQPWLATESAPERAHRLDRIWRLDQPELGDVLAAVAEHDPDSLNRKQARKSLFKLRQRI